MKLVIVLLIVSLFSFAETTKTKKIVLKPASSSQLISQRRPGSLENIQKMKVFLFVRDARSVFEIQRGKDNTNFTFHSQFRKTHEWSSPKRDFEDVGNILLVPGSEPASCKDAWIEVQAFSADIQSPVMTVTDCYAGLTESSKAKTQVLEILANLAMMHAPK